MLRMGVIGVVDGHVGVVDGHVGVPQVRTWPWCGGTTASAARLHARQVESRADATSRRRTWALHSSDDHLRLRSASAHVVRPPPRILPRDWRGTRTVQDVAGDGRSFRTSTLSDRHVESRIFLGTSPDVSSPDLRSPGAGYDHVGGRDRPGGATWRAWAPIRSPRSSGPPWCGAGTRWCV